MLALHCSLQALRVGNKHILQFQELKYFISHREKSVSVFCTLISILDCNYTFPINLALWLENKNISQFKELKYFISYREKSVSEFCTFISILDCNYTFPINLALILTLYVRRKHPQGDQIISRHTDFVGDVVAAEISFFAVVTNHERKKERKYLFGN